jgi:antitoxin component of MazEF toxin-antitoxin module
VTRRSIRVRPVRREQIDLQRLAAAIAALAADDARQQEAAADKNEAPTDVPRRAA